MTKSLANRHWVWEAEPGPRHVPYTQDTYPTFTASPDITPPLPELTAQSQTTPAETTTIPPTGGPAWAKQ